MVGNLYGDDLVEVGRTRDEVGHEKFVAFAEEEVLQFVELGGVRVELLEVDDVSHRHVNVPQDCDVALPLKVAAKDRPSERTARLRRDEAGERELLRRIQRVDFRRLVPPAVGGVGGLRLRVASARKRRLQNYLKTMRCDDEITVVVLVFEHRKVGEEDGLLSDDKHVVCGYVARESLWRGQCFRSPRDAEKPRADESRRAPRQEISAPVSTVGVFWHVTFILFLRRS